LRSLKVFNKPEYSTRRNLNCRSDFRGDAGPLALRLENLLVREQVSRKRCSVLIKMLQRLHERFADLLFPRLLLARELSGMTGKTF
jgi:hypothetical protein